jgi:DNA-directed RNA polymerase specialized sigma24 family protein
MSEEAKERPAPPEVATNDVLKAILIVLLDEREAKASERPGQVRSELMLADAGMSYQVIAKLLGKNPDAVRMTIARARRDSGAKRSTASAKKGALNA